MRTTITLDADAAALVKRAIQEGQGTFKQVVNAAIVRGLGQVTPAQDIDLPVHNMGSPRFDLTKALQIAGDLEDEEIVRKMALGK